MKISLIKIIEKIFIILILIIIGGLFFYLNLLKWVSGTDENPLSIVNIIQVGSIFFVGVGGWLIFKKIMDKHNKKVIEEYNKKNS